MSGCGVHESTDGGKTFAPLVDGMQVVEGFDPHEVTFHDPHCLRLCPSNPDRLYQQNHCGIYRLDQPATRWQRIGGAMPAEVGDIGFPIVVHPHDDRRVWVLPMDGSDVWPRTSPGGKPAVYATCDGGETWQRRDAGLPKEQAWWTVKRQAMCADRGDPVGLYFGTILLAVGFALMLGGLASALTLAFVVPWFALPMERRSRCRQAPRTPG